MESFNSKNNQYKNLHPNLDKEIDLLHWNIVVSIRDLTTEKAKKKFSKIKNNGTLVRVLFNTSGRGDNKCDQRGHNVANTNGDIPLGGRGSQLVPQMTRRILPVLHQVH